MVYARMVGGKVITLQVSGMLWNRSLVMQDVETESLWSHVLGRCMKGSLTGKQLEILPSVMTTWEDWKREHPETTVLNLRRSARGFERGFYRNPRRFVLGVVLYGETKAYPFDLLKVARVVEDRLGDEPVLITFDPESTRAVIFSRRLGEEVLSFDLPAKDGFLRDRKTGSRFSPISGTGVEGPLKGKRLEMLPGIVSFRKAWEVFHPDSRYHSGRTKGQD